MPQQIDRCRSCAAPIFDVDGVEGACACDEGIYLALLARQRHENRRGSVRTASTATDHALTALARQGAPEPTALDPMMFLSASARRELQAAQQERLVPRAPPGPGRGRPHPITDDPTDGFLDLALEDAPAPSDGLDFEFSSGDDIEVYDGPRPSSQERFRIDRPVVRAPFVARVSPGSQGGPMREVARIGRFALLREEPTVLGQSRQVPVAEVRQIFEDGARRDAREAAKLNAVQQEKRAAYHEKLPTAYDRVAAGNFLSDADDFD
jgi:hypothetical protein